MRRAKPVRQQWLFDGGMTKEALVDIWHGRDTEELSSLGARRNLFDDDGLLIRKVCLSDLERLSMGEDGRSALKQWLAQPDVGTIVLVDDRPASENPTIKAYADAVARGIGAAIAGFGLKVFISCRCGQFNKPCEGY